ncbi:MAG: hypothetical protein A3F61_00930 [Candidatus Blackburnbacteria bacterium RIFCSPHIGHO2_12_FULL_41_13b]|uniref:Glycosyltransferase RgtA/B/C/D-like domain-containing protein n=1 Tax=Candidatus Blackburnbacteria bacterium RIFCSPHIGHO2_12_FULL_41_13b TaxID=1797517 RepID=A0A1G1VCF4_9BACT|nr:MAG: hypothetical protein A3F61_00930 [Candidatus Blackburnbacteria bacterium RIFCSPHIGHO2_12_FULL_41_13b]
MLQIISKHKLLLLILALATILRLWGLGTNPPHLTNDEAALGYNAYSILKTARDEHGELLPIIFKSFGDWKPGLYIYATVPFVATLGLNEFSTRAASAVAGIVAVLLVYLIGKNLFSRRVALLSAVFLTISPWHLQFSRSAWEANFSLTLLLFGVYFFIQAVSKKPKYIYLSALFFALTLWAYQGAKLSSFLVLIILLLTFRKEIFSFPRKKIIIAFLIGVIVALPVIFSLLFGKAGRLEVYSVFSYPRSEEYIQNILKQENVTKDSLQYVLYHTEPFNFLRGIAGRWMNHYSGRFLFFEGDWSSPRHSVPETGVMLFADAVMLLLGLIALVRLKDRRAVMFVILWLLFAPIPAALSRDSIHAVRSLNMVIPLVFILALGSNYLLQNLQAKRMWQKGLWLGLAALYLFSFGYYLDQYWVHAPKKYSEYWHYGYKQLVEKLKPFQAKYADIVIQQSYAQPYIFFLFYNQYDPVKYQAISKEVFLPSQYGDVGLVSGFENIQFREISWREDRGKSRTLFVADLIKIPRQDSSSEKEFNLVGEIKYLNNKTALRLIEVK